MRQRPQQQRPTSPLRKQLPPRATHLSQHQIRPQRCRRHLRFHLRLPFSRVSNCPCELRRLSNPRWSRPPRSKRRLRPPSLDPNQQTLLNLLLLILKQYTLRSKSTVTQPRPRPRPWPRPQPQNRLLLLLPLRLLSAATTAKRQLRMSTITARLVMMVISIFAGPVLTKQSAAMTRTTG